MGIIHQFVITLQIVLFPYMNNADIGQRVLHFKLLICKLHSGFARLARATARTTTFLTGLACGGGRATTFFTRLAGTNKTITTTTSKATDINTGCISS